MDHRKEANIREKKIARLIAIIDLNGLVCGFFMCECLAKGKKERVEELERRIIRERIERI